MHKLILALFIFIVNSYVFAAMAQPVNSPYVYVKTGVPVNPNYDCRDLHNVQQACYSKGFKFENCEPGNIAEHGTRTIISKCKKAAAIDLPAANCLAKREKFMSLYDSCNEPTSDWNNSALMSCYGQDLRDFRQANCSSGCAGAPKYSVCDWTLDEYNKYKNCSSMQNTYEKMRMLICPNGRSDVDGINGPPPRLTIYGNRYPNRPNYLTYTQGFKVAVGSIYGGKAEYCVEQTLGECRTKPYSPIPFVFHNGTKGLIPDARIGVTSGRFTLFVRNITNGKTSKLIITKRPISLTELDRSRIRLSDSELNVLENISRYNFIDLSNESCVMTSGKGAWTELIGEELEPVSKISDKHTSYFTDPVTSTCNCVGREIKDTTNRRWKCIYKTALTTLSETGTTKIFTYSDGSKITKRLLNNFRTLQTATTTYNFYNYIDQEVNSAPGCGPIQQKCNENKVQFYLRNCWGGATPHLYLAPDSEELWTSYIYPGQFIRYSSDACTEEISDPVVETLPPTQDLILVAEETNEQPQEAPYAEVFIQKSYYIQNQDAVDVKYYNLPSLAEAGGYICGYVYGQARDVDGAPKEYNIPASVCDTFVPPGEGSYWRVLGDPQTLNSEDYFQNGSYWKGRYDFDSPSLTPITGIMQGNDYLVIGSRVYNANTGLMSDPVVFNLYANAPQYTCSPAPLNSSLCPGDNIGLIQDIASSLQPSCSDPAIKCKHTCNPGYTYSFNPAIGQSSCELAIEEAGICSAFPVPNTTLCDGDNTGFTGAIESSLVQACTTEQKCEHVCSLGYTYTIVDGFPSCVTAPGDTILISISDQETGDAQTEFNFNSSTARFEIANASVNAYACLEYNAENILVSPPCGSYVEGATNWKKLAAPGAMWFEPSASWIVILDFDSDVYNALGLAGQTYNNLINAISNEGFVMFKLYIYNASNQQMNNTSSFRLKKMNGPHQLPPEIEM